MKNFFALTIAASIIFVSSPIDIAQAAQIEQEGSYIIVLKTSQDADRNEKMVRDIGGSVERKFKLAINALSVKIKPSDVARLLTDPSITSIEIDQPMSTQETQSPSPSWGLDRIDQRQLPLDSSFTSTSAGENVDVYIVDTGLNTTHSDFFGRIGAGYTAVADGNGINDCNGHGTHVAGTAAGSIYGIAKRSAIIPVRVLGCSGSGSTSGVIAGLEWIISHHTAGKAAVANMSLGGGTSIALDTAVQNVINDGVTMTVAAGNSSSNACDSSPARVTNAITIGATGIYSAGETIDSRSAFSNFGPCLDIFAPGANITSTWIGSSTAINKISGTSMASPHVAGVAAALLGQFPSSTPAQIAVLLRNSATANVVLSAGTGSPNFLLYLEAANNPIIVNPPVAPTVPDTPAIGLATALARKSATATWTAPLSGGSPILSYVVNAYRDGNTSIASTQNVSASVFSASFSGLILGSTYVFQVQAKNAIGTGKLSLPSNSIIAKK